MNELEIDLKRELAEKDKQKEAMRCCANCKRRHEMPVDCRSTPYSKRCTNWKISKSHSKITRESKRKSI